MVAQLCGAPDRHGPAARNTPDDLIAVLMCAYGSGSSARSTARGPVST
jgi:hypothetical protein